MHTMHATERIVNNPVTKEPTTGRRIAPPNTYGRASQFDCRRTRDSAARNPGWRVLKQATPVDCPPSRLGPGPAAATGGSDTSISNALPAQIIRSQASAAAAEVGYLLELGGWSQRCSAANYPKHSRNACNSKISEQVYMLDGLKPLPSH